jgi:hypothetical protein
VEREAGSKVKEVLFVLAMGKEECLPWWEEAERNIASSQMCRHVLVGCRVSDIGYRVSGETLCARTVATVTEMALRSEYCPRRCMS